MYLICFGEAPLQSEPHLSSCAVPDQAARRAPSIIFLDELDGLVPARAKSGGAGTGGDQIYASVAATMLALMDGVADRGAVVVVGATNRCVYCRPLLHVGNC